MPATYEIYVDWSGTTTFGGPQDNISADVMRMRWSRGRESELENTPGGALELEVKDPSRDYSPENATSRFATASGTVTVGRWVRVRGTLNSTVYNLWRGRIETIIPYPEAYEKKASLRCLDGFDLLALTQINAPNPPGPATDIYVGGSGGAIDKVLDAAGWPTGTGVGGRSLDESSPAMLYWWANGVHALDAVNQLEKIDRGFCYIDEQGRFTFESRNHRASGGTGGTSDHLLSQGTFADSMVRFEYELSARSIRNQARVTVHHRSRYSSGSGASLSTSTIVYSNPGTPYLPASSTLTFWATADSPATSVITPQSGTHWRYYSDEAGLGTNRNDYGFLTFSWYGQVGKLVFANTGTEGVYIVPGTGTLYGNSANSTGTEGMVIVGRPLADSPLRFEAVDASSTATFGLRGVEVDVPFWTTNADAQNYADWLVSSQKDPRPDFCRMTVEGANDTLTDVVLKLRVSDRVTVTASNLGVSGNQYFINKVEHEAAAGRPHRTTYWLDKISTSTATGSSAPFGLVGITGYGELGTSLKTYTGF